MDMELDEGVNPLQSVVQQIIFQNNLLTKLRATDIVLNALDDKLKTKTKSREFKLYLHKIFNDLIFMRKLEYITKIKENIETGIEYTGMDYLSSNDFTYDVEFEKKSVEIEKRLAILLGSLLKEFSKGMEIEF